MWLCVLIVKRVESAHSASSETDHAGISACIKIRSCSLVPGSSYSNASFMHIRVVTSKPEIVYMKGPIRDQAPITTQILEPIRHKAPRQVIL